MAVLVLGPSPARAALSCQGQWIVQPSPNPGPSNDVLNAVAALSPTDAWAVGAYAYKGGATEYTLTLHWNGRAWTQLKPLNAAGKVSASLIAIDALSANDIWAVGSAYPPGGSRTLTAHWDGTSWNVISSPNPGTDNQLLAVSFSSDTNGWAVGMSDFQPFAIHWDGTSWTNVPTPPEGGGSEAQLGGVATTGDSDAWAVGGSDLGGILLHWDGTTWTDVAPADASAVFGGLAALSSSDAWAVGSSIERWNGSAWQVISSPAVTNGSLGSVSAPSSSAAWAVGSRTGYVHGTFVSRTLAEQWDGSSWQVTNTPNPNQVENYLDSVSALSGSAAWAVGYQRGLNSESRTLIMVHC